ncbi:hypothetical protein ScPMuIL_009033 [Solemya velum]
MSASRGKHAEVASARTRLDATLQSLVDKKDDGHLSSDEENPLPFDSAQPSGPSTTASPRKSATKSSRKRKRKDNSAPGDQSHYHHTYVMKLFDRSVDLAQFDDDTALYPICKAWMKNQPHDKQLAKRERTPTPEPLPPSSEEEGLDVFPDVYRLPSPIKLDPTEPYVDLRIPSPVPQPDEHLDINATGSPTSSKQLLFNHMERWKEVRQRWRDASHHNDMRHSQSLNLLKEMMDRQCKDS